MAQISVVEDDAKFRLNLILDLEEQGHRVSGYASGGDLLKAFACAQDPTPDLLLLDVRMPGLSGVDLVRTLARERTLPPTIIISGEASISETVEALGMGVHDFIEKPFSRQRLIRSIENCLSYHSMAREVRNLQRVGSGKAPILGESHSIQQLMNLLRKIAPTESRVLILGESGTGKELIADYLHHYSQRSEKPFVKINCASVPATLIEDQLFGHQRGAFTGAVSDKPGLFEEADTGTLFLDEIGEMELSLQTRLLRVLEDGRVRRLGARTEKKVNVRVIAATNLNLRERTDQGKFREDLFFRLNTLPVEVPPLRKREGDVRLLATYFLASFCKVNNLRPKAVTDEASALLEAYRWPGNVRELRNLCERLAILGGDPIGIEDLPSELFQCAGITETGLVRLPLPHRNMSLKSFKSQCEREFIESVLKRHNWDYVASAEVLDIQRTYLHRKIAQLGIQKPNARHAEEASC